MSNQKNELGWVYILHNASFKDGMIKIGFTNKNTPQERAQELSKHTGVPTEFEVVYAVQVMNAHALETQVHRILHDKRARNNREFFECSTDEAVKVIRQSAGRAILREMDLRNGQNKAFRQPENAKNSKNQHKNASKSKNKRKTGGFLLSLGFLFVLFLVAMLIVGLFVEEKEKNQNVTQNSVPTKTESKTPNSRSDSPKNRSSLKQSESELKAAWAKIPKEISDNLLEEQQIWEQEKRANCQKSAQKDECEIKENQLRIKYLRGFSID